MLFGYLENWFSYDSVTCNRTEPWLQMGVSLVRLPITELFFQITEHPYPTDNQLLSLLIKVNNISATFQAEKPSNNSATQQTKKA